MYIEPLKCFAPSDLKNKNEKQFLLKKEKNSNTKKSGKFTQHGGIHSTLFHFLTKTNVTFVLKNFYFLLRFIAFISARAKFFIYFSMRIYFFNFIYSPFKTPHIRLSNLYYISLKYQFLLFLKFFLFLHTSKHHPLSTSILEIRKEIINN